MYILAGLAITLVSSTHSARSLVQVSTRESEATLLEATLPQTHKGQTCMFCAKRL